MNLRFCIIIILIAFLASCKKKTIPPLQTYIEIGNAKGMIVTPRNDTFNYGMGISASLDIDINDDGKNDISFWDGRTGSPGSGYAQVTSLGCTEQVSFMGTSYNDSSFLYIDTIYSGFGNQFRKDMYHEYSFTRQHPNDLVIQNHYPFKTKVKYPSEILRQSDTFSSNLFFLRNRNPLQASCYQSKDTIICSHYNLNLQILPYSLNPVIYFGFRFDEGTTKRLGWIKFTYPEFRLVETAIQKN